MKLCIISNARCDLSELLTASFPGARLLNMNEAAHTDLNQFDCFACLAGATENSSLLYADLRKAVDAQIRLGKRFFAEHCAAIGPLRSCGTANTRFERPVALETSEIIGGMERCTILDEQSNRRLRYSNPTGRPILQYLNNPFGFYRVPESTDLTPKAADYALFLEKPNLLVCAFRMSHFARARFAPQRAWCQVISGIVRWLGGQCGEADVQPFFARVYRLRMTPAPCEQVTESTFQWLENADMFHWRDGLPYAVKEGLGAHVYPDGTHQVLDAPRPDCAGEVSLAYYLHSLRTGDPRHLAWSDGLMRYVMDCQCDVPGPHYGMSRWTESSWWVCYSDDAARGLLLPALMRALVGGDTCYLPAARRCLNYLLSITGKGGLPAARVDYLSEDEDAYTYMNVVWNEEYKKWIYSGSGEPHSRAELQSTDLSTPSAHYNAYYMAALLLFHLLTGEEKYLKAGVKGLTTIMSHYPATAREHSETQEYCRLMLPLAILFKVSDDPEHKSWLYRVANDLNRFRHPNGGFREWDTGYIATCAGVKDGESSVLAENGDPVSDLLYSANWLPTALSLAYFFTKDEFFREMRDYTLEFFRKTQIVSPDPMLNGIWPRSLDLDSMEVYGVPNDVGWAPWSVETGWTLGEILTGLELTMLEDRIRL